MNGTSKTIQGETDIAMQLPDKLMKMINIHDDGVPGDKMIPRRIEVEIVDKDKAGKEFTVTSDGTGEGAGKAVRQIIIKRPDGTTEELSGADADKVIVRDGDMPGKMTAGGDRQIIIRKADAEAHDQMRHNELLRLTLGLFLTAPQGADVNYTYGGEGDVDGTSCNIVVADVAGSAFKIYLGKSSNLPVMMTYTGMKMPMMTRFKADGPRSGEAAEKGNVVFMRKVDGPPMETSEFSVKFSDYRSVNGVQLPFKWTQTVGGTADEVFDVTSYEVNPANIADKFQNRTMILRTAKPDGQ